MRITEASKIRLLYFLVLSCTASWLPIFADYLKDHGLIGYEIGMILSVTPFTMSLIQPFYGMIADRVGYKKCLLLSSILASVSFTLYLFDGGFLYLFLVTVIMSVFYNTIQPLLDTLSLKLAQTSPSFSYGTLRIAGAAGWALTGTVVGYYIDVINTSVIFIFSSASMLLTFIFALALKSEKNRAPAHAPLFQNMEKVFTDRALLLLLISVVLVSAGATTIWNFYSLYMRENGATPSLVGYGISVQGFCELPLFYFSARIIKGLGIKTTLALTVFATAGRLLLYHLIKNPVAALFIELLHGISWSLFWVTCVEYVNSLVKEDYRATGQSLLYAAYFGVGAIAGNFWTGYLYDMEMKISQIFLLNSIVVGVVGLLICFLMKKPQGQMSKQNSQVLDGG